MDHRSNCKMQKSELLENTVEKLHDLGYGDAFIDKITKIQPMKEIIDHLNFIKTSALWKNIKRMRRQTTD